MHHLRDTCPLVNPDFDRVIDRVHPIQPITALQFLFGRIRSIRDIYTNSISNLLMEILNIAM